MNKKGNQNKAVIDAFDRQIHSGALSITFSRRDIIEGYVLGMLRSDHIVSKLDLHNGYRTLKIDIFKKDGVVTHARGRFLK